MEDITNKQLAKVRKDLDKSLGVFVSVLTMEKKTDDIQKVADYMASGDFTYSDLVKYTKALDEFHRRLLPILKKIER